MAKTRESEAPSATAIDPHNFPPYVLGPDESQAVHGRLADVDADYAPAGSAQAGQAVPRPPASGSLRKGKDGEEDHAAAVEAEAEAAKQANIDAGAAGSGDDTTGREVKVPEPDGGLEGEDDLPDGDEDEAEAKGEPEAEAEPDEEENEDEGEEGDEDDPNRLTVPELQAELDQAGVEYEKYARKAELVELVTEARENTA
jgi:hypothetical protein